MDNASIVYVLMHVCVGLTNRLQCRTHCVTAQTDLILLALEQLNQIMTYNVLAKRI